jgi:sugar lactone lactonase YvrE
VVLLLAGARAHAQPTVAAPYAAIYSLATFPAVPPSGATKPDDLAVSANGADLWVGYGNGVDTSGKGGASNLVEYEIASGEVLKNISIPGHLDGLKINPTTGDVWATENEDGNPTLAIISPKTGKLKIYAFETTLITGGMDDLVFSGTNSRDVFIVSSSQTDITKPAIVRISGKPKKTDTDLTQTLAGNPPSVWNVVTNTAETTDQIGDPDSMTLDPAGELVLNNRSDDSLYIVRAPTGPHPVLRVPLTLAGNPVEVNDTIFTTSATSGAASSAGMIFITDTSANEIYTLTKPYFPANEVYSAANVVNDVGLVDLNTGVVTPVVTGFQGLHGLAFAPNAVAIAQPKPKE